MEADINPHLELVERYITSWNEPDADRRRALIAQTWTGGARYLDPVMQGEGHAGIDAIIQGVQARFPGHRFRRIGEVDVHHDRIRFSWELGPRARPRRSRAPTSACLPRIRGYLP